MEEIAINVKPVEELHKIVTEEDLTQYLERFKLAYSQSLKITLAELSAAKDSGLLNNDVLTKVLINVIPQTQELALKFLGVDLQQETMLHQMKGMNKSIKDNRLIRCGEFVGNTIGYASQGGKAIPKALWTMLMKVGKEFLEEANIDTKDILLNEDEI